jgi:hypothetical protein
MMRIERPGGLARIIREAQVIIREAQVIIREAQGLSLSRCVLWI